MGKGKRRTSCSFCVVWLTLCVIFSRKLSSHLNRTPLECTEGGCSESIQNPLYMFHRFHNKKGSETWLHSFGPHSPMAFNKVTHLLF
jgi:hypothetical protein